VVYPLQGSNLKMDATYIGGGWDEKTLNSKKEHLNIDKNLSHKTPKSL
jgi:hypothetical protein